MTTASKIVQMLFDNRRLEIFLPTDGGGSSSQLTSLYKAVYSSRIASYMEQTSSLLNYSVFLHDPRERNPFRIVSLLRTHASYILDHFVFTDESDGYGRGNGKK